MDSLLSDLSKLSARAPSLYNSTVPSSFASNLDAFITQLETERASSSPNLPLLADAFASLQSSSSTRVKEYYNALARLGKALDKKFPSSLSGIADPNLFSSPSSKYALDSTVALHLMRAGEWEVAETLQKEAGIPHPSPHVNFKELTMVLEALHAEQPGLAIEWATTNSKWLAARGSPLEFVLHRSVFLRLATGRLEHPDETSGRSRALHRNGNSRLHIDGTEGDATMEHWTDAPEEGGGASEDGHSNEAHSTYHDAHPTMSMSGVINQHGSGDGRAEPNPMLSQLSAMKYGNTVFPKFMHTHLVEVEKLYTFLIFLQPHASDLSDQVLFTSMPLQYRHFLDNNTMHGPLLAPLFEAEWCARKGVAKEAPLKLAVEVGAGGALNRIAKVRAVMKQSGNEWSQADELPVEIPLPPHLRFHSTFACPVSKEQGTDENPPMMMTCGHVVCLESLSKIGKGSGRVKCPYCPTESRIGEAHRVYF
ncbi:Predicted E3 ubiquitin ligase [Ceraceosorus bombacis]|uniref:GID complex catalytic subunit 2 n=1 Tax=Ceraceosorus bombacis TaxID=401625 RepID=A0A0P1BNL1_9BASI|nr:Predicted E3 ubiquitin ligase [Ceraceosorus bombacis]